MAAVRRWYSEIVDKNIRQTDEWREFMEFLGWKCVKTSSGINVFFNKLLSGNLVKIQRPHALTKKDLEEIEALCKSRKALLVKIEPEVGQDESLLIDAGFEKNNYPLSPPSSMILNLPKSEKELWESISRSGKYSINRSKREGDHVNFVQKPSEEQIKQLFEAMVWAGKTKKYYIEPFRDVLKRTQAFGKNAHLIQVFNKSNDYLGGAIYLIHENTATFIYGSINEIGRQGKAGYQLLWQAALYLKKLGYKHFDLEGVDDQRFPRHTKSWGGFSHFKEKFNGTVVVYPVPYMKVYSGVLKFLSKLQPLPF